MYVLRRRKMCLKSYVDSTAHDQPADIHILIHSYYVRLQDKANRCYILGVSVAPYQIARMHELIWSYTVRVWLNNHFSCRAASIPGKSRNNSAT